MSFRILHGDSRALVPTLGAESISAVVTDPPYALLSIQKRWAKTGRTESTQSRSGPHRRASAGFMGQTWDNGETAFDSSFWAEILRVLKPGGHIVAFGGTRTFHRLVCAIEDAGFEIRDQLAWIYGSGFPKSHDVNKAIDGSDDWEGWGTALKPAHEPIVLARKPLIGTVASNVLTYGTGALNIDACRVEASDKNPAPVGQFRGSSIGATGLSGARDGSADSLGRWPANVVHDGSAEVLAAFPDTPGQQRSVGPEHGAKAAVNVYGDFGPREHFAPRGDAGSAARFFYSAKAGPDDRLDSKHPTVKPTDLMAWLVRMVTPKGGLVLDPFAGSGSTGMACLREGFDCVMIEREARFVADIERRLSHVNGSDTPLFGGAA